MARSPPAKKGTLPEQDSDEPALLCLVDKIANADIRKDLKVFLNDEQREKPPNIPCAFWNVVQGLAQMLNMVVEGHLSPVSTGVPGETTETTGSNVDTDVDMQNSWVQAGGRKRKLPRVKQPSQVPPSVNSDGYLEAVREQERLRSAVLCHVQESKAKTPRDQELEDETKVRFLIHKIDQSLKVDRVYRLGGSSTNKARLIKVVFCTSQMQRTALVNAKKLRDVPEGKGVYLRASMTREQLQQFTLKRKKLHYLRSIDKNWVIYREDFWLKNEIGKQCVKTTPPEIPTSFVVSPGTITSQNQGN